MQSHKIIQNLLRITLLALVSSGICFSQSLTDQFSQEPSQNVDCSDPTMAASPDCTNQGSSTATSSGSNSAPALRTPVLTNPGGANVDQYVEAPAPSSPSQVRAAVPLQPRTEFEQMVADSLGRPLPMFGASLFVQSPSTFSPVDWMQVPEDYVIGPGDELQIAIWGQIQANLRVIVDRAGEIYIPQVGQVSVAGVHYGDLEEHLKRELSKIFKNFNISVNLGKLRSIQVLVVGKARYPGTYTISALSTLVNAIFSSGGPAPQGSLRHIQVRRSGMTIANFDLYDLLVKGDKSGDVRLQSGDVIYIPPVGPLVAISGSVNMPAIYEVKDRSTLADLLEIAGGMSTMADINKITIDRVVDHQARKTLEFPYDDQSRGELVKDGDIVRVLSIVPRFEETVTLRGHVTNPGRYPWKPGMRISDLIPNAQALLTRDYWRDRAAAVNGLETEYPIQAEHVQSRQTGTPQTTNTAQNPKSTTPDNGGNPAIHGNERAGQNGPAAPATGSETSKNVNQSAGNQEPSTSAGVNTLNSTMVNNVAENVRMSAPEINWDYAIIQRVNPLDLSSRLIWVNPRKAILQHDPNSNLQLQPGDIVTIFSQRDISVPQTERSQYVIVEGEVSRSGVYKLEPNETLRSILERAGGLTPNAYVYGTQFTRESARISQQKSLNELAQTMEIQIRQSAVSVAAASNGGDAAQIQAAQESIISQLRNTRASGRVALPLKPTDKDIVAFPDIVLEDGDHISIPHTPSTVSVIGDVYNPGSFIFVSRNNVGSYLEIAGKGKPQSDLGHAFVLRANGVVVAANNVNGLFGGDRFNRLPLYPGDQIVVPYKLPTGAFMRGLRDWTQVTSQIALTAASIAVIAP